MNENVYNMQVRKFLKEMGVTSQRELDKAIRQAVQDGRIDGKKPLRARAVITVDALGLSHEIESDIELE